jgi:dTDP-4-amino-4,6-dideoxygalactose transaminase
VLIDIDANFYSIDETKIEAAITAKTKAIIPVHLQGQMCHIEAITAIAKKYNLYVIEDCAQSHFSAYNNQLAGTFGIAASFSFYPGKNLGAYGDAGCIITNNDALATKCKMYARHGALVKHQHQIEGINSRLDGLQAAILTAKLPYILQWTEQRIYNANLYNQALKNIPQIVIPAVRDNSKHTFHLYVIRCQQRNALAAILKEKGIETAIHYPTPLHEMEAYQYLGYQPTDFPIAHQYKNEILSLPMYPELTEQQINYIAQQIQLFYQ